MLQACDSNSREGFLFVVYNGPKASYGFTQTREKKVKTLLSIEFTWVEEGGTIYTDTC